MKNHIIIRLIFSFLLLFGLTISGFCVNIVFEKSFEYPVDSLQKIKINNQHGNIHIRFADTDSIYMDVKLSAELDSKLDSTDFFNGVNYGSEKSSGNIDLQLIVDPEYASNYLYKSNIEIKAPYHLYWQITNRFGDIFSDSTLLIQSLTLDYGHLNVKHISNLEPSISMLSLFQAQVQINSIDNAIIKCVNTIIKAEHIKEAIINSEFSTLEIAQADILNLTSETDNYTVLKAGNIKFKGMYSEVKIGSIIQNLETELNYGKFKLSNQNIKFETIDINHQNVTTRLVFSRETPFNLNADIKYCSLVIDPALHASVRRIDDGALKIYNGVVGDAETNSSLTIISRFEDIHVNSEDKR